MKIIISVFLLAGTLVSCSSSSDDIVISDFKKVIHLESKTLPINSADLGDIVDMISFDSLLVINEVFQDKIFKCFNVNTGKKIGEFISRGKGPNELSFPRLLNKVDENTFTTYDENKKDLIYLKISDFSSNTNKFSRVVNFDQADMSIFKCYPINDSLFIFSGAFDEGRYIFYNLNTNNAIAGLDFPTDDKHKKESNFIKGWAYQGEISKRPDFQEFVFICKNGYIEIFNADCSGFQRKNRLVYFLSDYKVLNNNVAHSSESRYAFHSVKTTKKYIYLIYSGRSRKESGSEYYAGNNVLVYDWDGNPVLTFKIDRFIKRMAFDENEMVLYGYSTNPVTGEPEIVSCQLPKH